MNNLHQSSQLTMSKEQKDEQKNKPTLWEIIGVPIALGCLKQKRAFLSPLFSLSFPQQSYLLFNHHLEKKPSDDCVEKNNKNAVEAFSPTHQESQANTNVDNQ
mmetsp:Transcript_24733/g.34026  ORF Transcript_24733/g.34026 Transcript_24733/m.34026 type:complete len:103 (+) Transcript_24733:2-310(+)